LRIAWCFLERRYELFLRSVRSSEIEVDVSQKKPRRGKPGIEIDGPVGSDAKLLGLGMSIEAILGTAPPPKL